MRAAASAIALCGLLACTGSAPAEQAHKKRASPLRAGVAVPNPGVVEPSGIAFHAGRRHLFVVGDEGTLAELDEGGRLLRATPLGANLEDVAVHDPSGNLVLLDEVNAELIVYDPQARAVRGRWRLDTDALVGKREKGRDGFEGLAFRAEPGRAGGGVFYLVHQRGPATLVAVAFDPTAPAGRIGASEMVGRWGLRGHRDLTAVSWAAALDRLLVLADAEDELLLVRADGTEESRVALPGVQQEGVCLDAAGNLWVADDRGASVVRYAGAREVLERARYSMVVK